MCLHVQAMLKLLKVIVQRNAKLLYWGVKISFKYFTPFFSILDNVVLKPESVS